MIRYVSKGDDELKRTKLKKARVKSGLSQRELADKLGIAEITVRQIENGNTDPGSKLAVKYANFFKKPLEQLFPDIFLLKFDTKSINQKV